MMRPLRWFLEVPLFWKLIGANAIIVALAAVLLSGVGASIAPIALPYDYFVLGGLAIAVAVNILLVRVALEPIRELQRVAELVAKGASGERGRIFPQADDRIRRLIETTNLMLDRLTDDRKKMKQLAAAVVSAQQQEGWNVARDLHDSVAQTLAAATYLLTGALNNKLNESAAGTIRESQELIRSACEELRALSQSLHPRVASDLGLPAALESLAGIVRQRSLIDVFIVSDIDAEGIPASLTPTLYWVASEALHEVELRGNANSATIALKARDGDIELTVIDDGTEERSIRLVEGAGAAFKAAQDRFSLAGGQVHIDRTPDGGQRVTARIVIDRMAA